MQTMTSRLNKVVYNILQNQETNITDFIDIPALIVLHQWLVICIYYSVFIFSLNHQSVVPKGELVIMTLTCLFNITNSWSWTDSNIKSGTSIKLEFFESKINTFDTQHLM